MQNWSTFSLVQLMCCTVIVKQWVIFGMQLNLQLVISVLLSGLTLVYYCWNDWVQCVFMPFIVSYPDSYKFVMHVLFVCTCSSLLCEMIYLLGKITFVFGFMDTILYFTLFTMLLASGIIKQIIESVYQLILHYTFGLVVPLNLCSDILDFQSILYLVGNRVCYYCVTYLFFYGKLVVSRLTAINDELANNSHSRHIYSELIVQYYNLQIALMRYAMQLAYPPTLNTKKGTSVCFPRKVSKNSIPMDDCLDDLLDDLPKTGYFATVQRKIDLANIH